MKILGAVLVSLIGLQQAFAGAAQTHLSCKEVDGKISLSGDVPGDSDEFDLTLKMGDKQSRIYSTKMCNPQGCTNEENGTVAIVEALNKGVYTMKASRHGEALADVQLYALPKTVKVKKLTNGQTSNFGGVLRVYDQAFGTEPRTFNVLCTTEYSI